MPHHFKRSFQHPYSHQHRGAPALLTDMINNSKSTKGDIPDGRVPDLSLKMQKDVYLQ